MFRHARVTNGALLARTVSDLAARTHEEPLGTRTMAQWAIDVSRPVVNRRNLARVGGGLSVTSENPTPGQSGLAALVLLMRFHGVGADPEQIRHRFGNDIGVAEMLRCAKEFGLKARSYQSTWGRLANTPLPGIAVLRDGRFLIIGKAGEDQVLVQDPLAPRPALMNRADFEAIWDGRLVLMAAPRGSARTFAPLRRHLVSRRHTQIPASARRGADRLVLPPAFCAGFAAVLPGRYRQGSGPSQLSARSTSWSSDSSPFRCSRPFSASCAPICSRTRPTASTSSWAPACSAICWRCRSPISRRGGSAIQWRGCASWRTSATF